LLKRRLRRCGSGNSRNGHGSVLRGKILSDHEIL
jgi:hypothetical protein